jgi:hypothetical protein
MNFSVSAAALRLLKEQFYTYLSKFSIVLEIHERTIGKKADRAVSGSPNHTEER